MIEWTQLAAIISAVASGLAVLGFWMRFSDRVTRVETSASQAIDEYKELNERISVVNGKLEGATKELGERVTTVGAALGIHRETVAEKYVSRDMMREIEERLITAINKSERMTTENLSQLSARIEVLYNGRRRTRS